MIRNYLKVAYRNLIKHKVFTLVNVVGLSCGLAAVFLITLFLRHELSYDRFVDNSENIYRVVTEFNGQSVPTSVVSTADYTELQFPEIEASTKVLMGSWSHFHYQTKKYGKYRPVYVDEGFLDVFSLKVLKASHSSLLETSNTAVLSSQTASEIFGKRNPLNEQIMMDGREYTVVGVIENVPENFHLQFDALFNINTLDENNYLNRVGNALGTYLLFDTPLNKNIEFKISQSIEDHVEEIYSNQGYDFSISFQPLEKIYLYSDFSYDYARNGIRQNIVIFSVVALFILVVALFNFLNLSIVKSNTRVKEVGVRKVNGAMKNSIRKQFVAENLIVSLISFCLAMLLVESFINGFSELTNSSVDFSYSQDFIMLLLFLGLTLVIGVFAGFYPANHIARFNPVRIFNNDFNWGGGKQKAQVVMVTLQFVIAVALIASALGLNHQVRYLKNKDLGYQKEQIMAAHGLTEKIRDNFSDIKPELLNHNAIEAVTASMRIPGNRGNGKTLRLADDYKENAFSIDENLVQPGFIETYSIPLIKGRTFRDNPESDKRSILVNETTVKKLGVSDPIGKEVMNGGFRCKIIGVFKDCHFRSLHHKIQPFILSRRLERNYWISIRVREGMIKDAIDYTRNVLEDYDPQYSFQHLFVKDYLDRNYRSDQKTLTLILSGTLLAILISIMGLFALTAFNIERRNKEIGIRKSLGATSSRIIKMFLFHYLKWILISAFIAFPLSYWFMERWLRNFAYHSDIEWWFFGSALMISILVAGITILIKAFQAANKNPVNTLRYE